ncbi:MAG: carbon storage regulator [Longimicrobiales bacterium]
MLILSRKPGDAILIDGGIRIVVIASDSGSVRIGIEAPASVGIVREEIARSVAEENLRAGAPATARTFLESLDDEDGKDGGPKGGSRKRTPGPADPDPGGAKD